MLPPSWKGDVQKTVEESANADRRERETQAGNAAAQIAAAIDSLTSAQNAQTGREDSNQRINIALSIIVILVASLAAFFAGLSWWVFHDQLGTFNDQLTEMRKVYGPIKESADAAKDAAAAASQQVIAMQGQLAEMKNQRLATIAQVRANLRHEPIETHPITKDNKIAELGDSIAGWDVNSVWINTGSTDARKFISWFEIFVKPYPPIVKNRINVECPIPERPARKISAGIASPGGKVTEIAQRISVEDVISASGENPTKIIYIAGHAEYIDIFFPESPAHHFDWCKLMLPNEPNKNIFSFPNVCEDVD